MGMEDELEKTVSVYSGRAQKEYKIVICRKKGHEIINLNDFKKNEITFGRASSNDIVIDENIVSGHHGKFILNEGLKIVDNNSTNGIFINGEQKDEFDLSDGDTIKIDNPNTSLKQAVIMNVVLGDEPSKCPNCKESLNDKEETPVEETKPVVSEPKVRCLKCGKELGIDEDFCKECGTRKGEYIKKKKVNPVIFIVIGAILLVTIIAIIVGLSLKGKDDHDNLPPKVDISMTSYYGTIENILDEFGLDFDLVTMGGNCYTGVQKAEFETKKYGILHTEYRYCKANNTLTFRVYNTDKDQELRDPKPGEIPKFDKYGYKSKGGDDDSI